MTAGVGEVTTHPPTARQATALAMFAAAATGALYWRGSSRAFGWDASNTVGRFVATPSLLDPFRRQVSFNNQVLFSALEHAVYSVTGSASERTMRVLPVVFAIVTVGILTRYVTLRLGSRAGLAAAAVLAANPLAVTEFRDARGYSILVLAALVSTTTFWRLHAGGQRRGLVALYVASVAAGVASHLYMLAVVAVHVAIVGMPRPWVRRWALAIGLGLAVALVPVSKALTHHQYRSFWAVFPLRLGYDLLGGQPLAFVLLAPLAAAGVWHHRDRAKVRALTMVATLAALVWLVGPEFLYSRYFLWLLPGVAYAVALSVARRPWLLAVVAVAVGAQLLGQLADMGESPLPNRVAAAVLARADREGARTCAIRSSATTLAAYAPRVEVVRRVGDLRACDVVAVAEGPFDPGLVAAARREFRYAEQLPAEEPGLILSRTPPPSVPPDRPGVA